MDGLTNAAPGDAAAEIDKLIAGGDDELIIPDLADGQGGDDEIEIVDEPVAEPAKAAEPEPAQEAKPPTIDDAAEALKAQLAERDRQIAALKAESDTVKKTAWEEKLDGTKAVLSSALEAIKGDIVNAKREMREAMESGEYDKVTDLSERLGVLGANRTRVEEGLGQLNSEIERAKKAPAPQPQRQPQTQDEFIDAHIANATPATANWLKGNRDFFTDQKKHARVMAAHHLAIADGITPQADEAAYWSYIDGKLGDGAKASEPKRAAPSPITAPSSRQASSPSGASNGGKITLTRAEVEVAQALGMTNKEYAFYKAQEAKKALN